MHVPPNDAKVPSLMTQFVSLLTQTTSGPVGRAVLAHHEFVAIHPFRDGNGRIGRLLMNLVLLRAGLPWITIRNDERAPYFAALERASVHTDIEPFARFILRYVQAAVKAMQ
jgi:Fic family protein